MSIFEVWADVSGENPTAVKIHRLYPRWGGYPKTRIITVDAASPDEAAAKALGLAMEEQVKTLIDKGGQ